MSSDAAPTPDLQHIKFNVAMSCGGCSGAVTRALSKVEGLDKFDVSLENQTADVWAPKDTVDSKAIIQKVLKTGKTVNSVTINGETVDLAPIRAEL